MVLPTETRMANAKQSVIVDAQEGRTAMPCERLINAIEAAAILKISTKTLKRLARKGSIPAMHVGRQWRFRASALNDWVEKRLSKNPQDETVSRDEGIKPNHVQPDVREL